MMIGRRWQAEQALQEHMQIGCGFQIGAADDMGYALQRIVDDRCEVIAGRGVLAHDDGIAPAPGRATQSLLAVTKTR